MHLSSDALILTLTAEICQKAYLNLSGIFTSCVLLKKDVLWLEVKCTKKIQP